MLARNMVIREGSQPITLQPSKAHNGFRIINGSIHILYDLELYQPGNDFYRLQRDGSKAPFIVSVKADDFLVSEPYENATDRPIVEWMVNRARRIVDRKVAVRDWSIKLSDAGRNQYFKVHIEGGSDVNVHPKLLEDHSFLWTCFFLHDSEKFHEIETQYEAEAL